MLLKYLKDINIGDLKREILTVDTIGFSPIYTLGGNQVIHLYQLGTDFVYLKDEVFLPMRIIISHEEEMWEYYAEVNPYDIIKIAVGKKSFDQPKLLTDPKDCSFKSVRVNKDVDPGCNYVIEFGVSPEMVSAKEGDHLFSVKFNTNDSTPGWGYINIPMLEFYCEAILQVRGQ